MPCRRLRRHRGFILALTLAFASPAAVATTPLSTRDRALIVRVNALLREPQFQRGFWGVYVYSLDRRQVLVNHDGDQWFTPASNAKLFTLAAALHLLGPGFKFHTPLAATAAPDAQGVIQGDLVLRGVGDPSFTGRPYPYREAPPGGSPLDPPYDLAAAPRALAAQLVARGVTRVSGDVIGDDSCFAGDPYPGGWAVSDLLWDYGAPVSALTLNDNTRYLQVRPGAAVGALLQFDFVPALSATPLDDHAVTLPAGARPSLRLSRDAASGALELDGGLPLGAAGELEALSVADPALFAAQMLRQALLDQGIAVGGVARARHTAPADSAPLHEVGGWDSPPLAQILQTTAKLSQNLEAELMLRTLGKLRGQPGADTGDAGDVVVRQFLHDAGLAPADTALTDGSGLARSDLVTPAGVVRLLTWMSLQPDAATFRSLLPVAGVDGTLAHRFHDSPAAGRLSAKTGSLSHVNSLSGYVTTAQGERLAFSLLSNNLDLPAAEVRAQLDRLAIALAQ